MRWNATLKNLEFAMNSTVREQPAGKIICAEFNGIYLYLNITLRSECKNPVFHISGEGISAPLKTVCDSDGSYTVSLNITNYGECSCLPQGYYSVVLFDGDKFAGEIVLETAKLSHTYRYGAGAGEYTVSLADFEKGTISVKDTCKNAGVSKVTLAKNLLIKLIYKLSCKKKSSKKTLLFMSEQSDKLGSNLSAVIDRLYERGLDREFNILTSARPMAKGVGLGFKSWLKLAVKLGRSDFLFTDDHAPILDWLELDDKVTFVQLWHAGAGFKSAGYARFGNEGGPKPVSGYRRINYGTAGSRNIAPFFSEVFGINDDMILPTGMPRMDKYLDESHRKKKTDEIYSAYPTFKGKKIILFAPTYRGTNQKDAYYPYDKIDFEALYKYCTDTNSAVIFKMHPWVREKVPFKAEFSDRFFDFNSFADINDLFYITDVLITDYSSNIYEFSLMKKPMIFYAFDKEEYSLSRGFHRDFDKSAPGKVCSTFSLVMNCLENSDFDFHKVEEYVSFQFDYIDSFASDRVIDWIILGNKHN